MCTVPPLSITKSRCDPSGAQAIPVSVPVSVIQGVSVKFTVSMTVAREARPKAKANNAPKSAIQREGLMLPNIGQMCAPHQPRARAGFFEASRLWEQQPLSAKTRCGRVTYLVRCCFAMSRATSSIMSSCPPIVLRRPNSTKMSREATPYFSPHLLAKSKNDEYTPA